MDRILDAENAWKQFLEEVTEHQHSDLEGNKRRYVRINPTIPRVPPLDATGHLQELQIESHNSLDRRASKIEIQTTAHKLIASCFYYERLSKNAREENDMFFCAGSLLRPINPEA